MAGNDTRIDHSAVLCAGVVFEEREVATEAAPIIRYSWASAPVLC
jgi:hypothetical protein